MSGMSSDWVVLHQGKLWQDLYTRGKITVEQPRNIVFSHIQETCRQLKAEVYETDSINYSIHAKARTSWKTFGHKFHIVLGRQDCGTVIELYYNFVGMRGGPYRNFANKFFKILARKTALPCGIKFDVVNLEISKTKKRSIPENISSQLCIRCRTTITIVLISLVAIASLSPAYAVTFTDHTGYIPSWAQSMGQSQALGVCINTEYGTADSRWCAEFSGYVVDQQKAFSTDISQPQITSQLSRTMFSGSSIYDESNHDKDPLNRFSITRPVSWVMQDSTTGAVMSFGNRDDMHPASLSIFRDAQDANPIDWSSMTDKEIQTMLSHSFAQTSDVIRYSDGIKITYTGLNADNDYTAKQKAVFYWFDNGIKYTLIYTADVSDFDQYLDDAEKSIDTFYVSEKSTQLVSSGEPIPEFGPISGAIIAVSIIGSLVIAKRFSKI